MLLGQSGFWGTPIANEKCRTADLIVAIGTRLAEANSSSWDPRFTFSIPPTRLIHIDADLSEIGRNYQTELGVCADAKLALAALADEARGKRHADRGRLKEEIARGRKEFASNWADQWSSSQYPLRPERILSELRRAAPADAFIVTDVGWNKNGVGQQFPIDVPGAFITPSGLATMGFGPAAALGVKVAQPKRHAIALIGDGGFSANPSVIATAMEAGLRGDLGRDGQLGVRHHRRSRRDALRHDVRLHVRVRRQAVSRRLRRDGALVWRRRLHGERRRRTRPALEAALASGRPTVIQVPMENAPTPTPGHWDINDIYRRGE